MYILNLNSISILKKVVNVSVILTIISIILIIVLYILTSKKNEIKIGNSQLIGQRSSQNDYFATLKKDGSLLTIVSDGASTKKIGKYASIVSVEILKSNFIKGLQNLSFKQFYETSFLEITKRLNDNIYANKTAVTVATLIIKNNLLNYVIVGNCLIFLLRNGELIALNDLQSNHVEKGQLNLKRKDILLICTIGVYNSLTEIEIMETLKMKKHPYEKALSMSKQINRKGFLHQDNATLVILEI